MIGWSFDGGVKTSRFKAKGVTGTLRMLAGENGARIKSLGDIGKVDI